jgi:uncharacterized protein (TIGR02145 family)
LVKFTKMGTKISSYTIILGTLLLLSSGCKKEESPPGPVSDIDGISYKTVKIGEQIWMAENLKTTRYNDGTEIPIIADATAWSGLKKGGYCWYKNDELSHKDTYGAIYNGYAVNSGMLCPTGWHVPEREDWLKLREFTGDSIKGGGKLKEAGTLHWLTPNKGADNSSGFTALASGMRYFEGSFASLLSFTGFWSSTVTGIKDIWYMSLYYGDATFTISHITKNHGFSVRCIKDDL